MAIESQEVVQAYPEFKPGDLIRSAGMSVWAYIDNGISSARRRGVRGRQLGDNMISFAMLGNDPNPADRSNKSHHSGPTYMGASFHGKSQAIVIDRAKLLERYPDNVAATGDMFGNSFFPNRSRRYEYTKYNSEGKPTEVYGIPINKGLEGEFYIAMMGAWDDDVIVYSHDSAHDPVLTSDLWAAYVIKDDTELTLTELQRDLQQGIARKLADAGIETILNQIPNVPIINARTGKAIGKTLRDIAKDA